MLNTKDIRGFLAPLATVSQGLSAVSIPDAPATLPAATTAGFARDVGFQAEEHASVLDAVKAITAHAPDARILICGSLYLAGDVLRENG